MHSSSRDRREKMSPIWITYRKTPLWSQNFRVCDMCVIFSISAFSAYRECLRICNLHVFNTRA
jgi:hypothetical protein